MQQKDFEIGLVMAGAVSAGAYTAGVIDYLLQALKEWETAKKNNTKTAPPHQVKLKVIAGSSAGGMTGAIMTAMVNGGFKAITTLPEREPDDEEVARNNLYSAWVEQIDISELLGDDDLKKENSKVISLLDSTILEKIADSTIRFKPSEPRPSFIAKQLQLYLTLTNLHGIPYHTTFKGKSGKGHSITKHTDYFHFLLSSKNREAANGEWLNAKDASTPNWDVLKNVAIATGAFPFGLSPRAINRAFSNYSRRKWRIPLKPDPGDPSSPNACFKYEHIEPAWPSNQEERFNFLAVDGGVMDNEPTELTRRALAEDDLQNPRSAEEANRSLIMIDPFPSKKQSSLYSGTEIENKGIGHVFMKLLDSLKSQSRFDPDELILAASNDVYSRFLIAPTRFKNEETIAAYPIASGSLHGFGGFLSKKFRKHDFQLGRRNCQQFLRKYFAIPVEKAKQNAVFANYSEADFKRFSFQKKGEAYLPIIPILDEAKKEAKPLQWSTLAMKEQELELIRNQLSGRAKLVTNRLIEEYIDSGISRALAKAVAWFKRDDLVDKMMQIIKEDLDEFDLR